MFRFLLPDIGEGLTEASIAEWLVEPGGRVAVDEPLVQIETDKALVEIPAPRAGVLLEQGAPTGTVLKVGDLLAVIGDREEGNVGTAEPTLTEPPPLVGTLPEPVTLEEADKVPAEGPARRVEVPPPVRRLARELGVDVQSLEGTGPNGRITRIDVEAAADQSPRGDGPTNPSKRIPFTPLRRAIAQNVSASWREIPQVTTLAEVDAESLLRARRSLQETSGTHLPLEAMLVRAVLPALAAYPEFNATVDGHDLLVHNEREIGLAVDAEGGLIVVVVRDGASLGIGELGAEISRLLHAARNRTATQAELTGATFTISNIGAVGGWFGTPIVPAGTTAILSFGRIEERPAVRDGQLVVASLMPLSLSYDHRAIDGAMGRRFIDAVRRHIEEPILLVANGGAGSTSGSRGGEETLDVGEA